MQLDSQTALDITVLVAITVIVSIYFITVGKDGTILYSILTLILGYFVGRKTTITIKTEKSKQKAN
jgi:hypothetical protein